MAKGADYMELRYIHSFKSQVKRCDHSLWGPLCCAVLVTQSCPTLWPHGLQPSRLLCPWGFSKEEYLSGLAGPPPGDLPNPGIKPRSPTLQADSFPSEPSGNPKNTRVESLSLLQGNFSTQGSNPGLLHCKQILYHLSHQGKWKWNRSILSDFLWLQPTGLLHPWDFSGKGTGVGCHLGSLC